MISAILFLCGGFTCSGAAVSTMEEMMKRWKTMVLTEKEDLEVDIRAAQQESLLPSTDIQLCVVAKIMMAKKVNAEAFKAVMLSIWKVHYSTKIQLAGDNIFFIQFRSMVEKLRVMSEGPWTFDRSLVVLNSPKDFESISKLVFSEISIWIQVHNVPFKCLTRAMAQIVGESIGCVEDIDCDDSDAWTGPFLRIRVTIEVEKPLLRGIKLRASDESAVWCPIMYEKLPDFCHNCGVLGHSHRECQVQSCSATEGNVAGYGDWMKATILKRSSQIRWFGGNGVDDTSKELQPPSARGGYLRRWGRGGRSDVERWRSPQTDEGFVNKIARSSEQGQSSVPNPQSDTIGQAKLKVDGEAEKHNLSSTSTDVLCNYAGDSLEIVNQNDTVESTFATVTSKNIKDSHLTGGGKLMEIDPQVTSTKAERVIKKYKTKTPLIQSVKEGDNIDYLLLKSKRKWTESEELESVSFAKKNRMEDLNLKSVLAETAQQSRQEL